MEFVEVENLPDYVKSVKGAMEKRLEEFMGMNVKYAKVQYHDDEYSSPNGCRLSVIDGIKRYGVPVNVVMIRGVVYLIRRDL